MNQECVHTLKKDRPNSFIIMKQMKFIKMCVFFLLRLDKQKQCETDAK